MQFVLSADSTCDLYAGFARENGIRIAPMRFTVEKGGVLTEYKDAFTAYSQYAAFFNELRAGAFSRTSMLNFEQHLAHFSRIFEEGARELVHVSLSGGLSPTADVAAEAAKAAEEKYPGCRAFVVDSLGATAGSGALVKEALALRDAGLPAAEAAAALNALRMHQQYVIVAGDLYYLKRGGRVSAVAAVAGTLLQVKPVLNFTRAGTLAVVEKCRGMKKAYAFALSELQKFPPDPGHGRIVIVHTDAERAAGELAALVQEAYGRAPEISIMGPVIGSHLGPDAVGMGWFSRAERR